MGSGDGGRVFCRLDEREEAFEDEDARFRGCSSVFRRLTLRLESPSGVFAVEGAFRLFILLERIGVVISVTRAGGWVVSIGVRVASLRRVVTTTEDVTGFEDLAFEDEKKARSEPDGLAEEEIMAFGGEREDAAALNGLAVAVTNLIIHT